MPSVKKWPQILVRETDTIPGSEWLEVSVQWEILRILIGWL
jgi:hypothetical protein